MADETINIGIGIQATDDSGVDLVQQLDDSVKATEASIRKAQRQGGLPAIVARGQIDSVTRLRRETDSLTSEIGELTRRLSGVDAGTDEFKRLTAQMDAARQKAAALNAEINRTSSRVSERGGDLVGRTDTGLSSAAGLAGGLGAGDLGAGLQLGSDALAVADAFKQLSGELVNAPGFIGKVASAGAALAAPLGATAAGFAAVFAVLAPAGLLLAAVAAGIHLFNQGVEGAKKAFEAALVAQENYYNALATMTSEQVEAEKARLQDLQVILQQQRDETARAATAGDPTGQLQQRLDELDKQMRENEHTIVRYTQGLEQNTFAANDAALALERENAARRSALQQRIQLETELAQIIRDGNQQALDARRQGMMDEINAIRANLPDLQALAVADPAAQADLERAEQRIQSLTDTLAYLGEVADPAVEARARENSAIKDALSALEARAKGEMEVSGLIRQATTEQLESRRQALELERGYIQSILAELMVLAATSDEAKQSLENYEGRIADINAELNNLSAAAPEVRLREVREGLQEIEEAEIATGRAIADIRAAGLARLADLETDAANAQIAAAKKRDDALAANAQQAANRINAINAEYMRTEREAFEKYREAEKQAAIKNSKERIKLLNQINADLLDAENNNDVVAFKRAKATGEAQLRDLKDNQSEADAQRKTQFLNERKEADRRHQEQLDQIRTQEAERQAAIVASYQAEQAAIQQRLDAQIAAEEKAISQKVAAEEAALYQRLLAIQKSYGLEQALIDQITQARLEDYKLNDQIVAERLAADMERHKQDLERRARDEVQVTNRLATDKKNIEARAGQDAARSVQNAFVSATSVIASQINGLIAQVVGATNAARSQLASGAGYNSSAFQSSAGGTRTSSGFSISATAFANEGIVTKPTFGLIGEKLAPGEAEAVVKFKMSEGLPSRLGDQTTINVGQINVGNGVSAAEVESAFNQFVGAMAQGLANARSSSGQGRLIGGVS